MKNYLPRWSRCGLARDCSSGRECAEPGEEKADEAGEEVDMLEEAEGEKGNEDENREWGDREPVGDRLEKRRQDKRTDKKMRELRDTMGRTRLRTSSQTSTIIYQ